MRLIPFLFILFVFVSTSCKKTYPTTIIQNDTTIVVHNDTTIIHDTTIIQHFDTTILQDGTQQISFILPSYGTNDTSFVATDGPYGNLNKFDIDYYSNIDSVIYSFFATVPKGQVASFWLYNATDKSIIDGSVITVTGTNESETYTYVQSGNIMGLFPHKEISLGVALKAQVQFKGVSVGLPVLYLYRKP